MKLQSRKLIKEDGFAAATVLGVVVASMAFVSVAALASTHAMRGTVGDEDGKMALAAAEAGATAALVRQNTAGGGAGTSCVTIGGGSSLVSGPIPGDGWCPAVAGTIDSATYSYQVAPTPGELKIVSVGTSDGVSRRVELLAGKGTDVDVFTAAGLIGLDYVAMHQHNEVHTGLASNGSIAMEQHDLVCGGV